MMARIATRPKHGSDGHIDRIPPRLRRVLLYEYVLSHAPLEVDREAGIIKNVKILGYESKNGRRYTAEAMQRAKPLYEGVHVNIDHPHVLGKEKPDAPRSSYDRFGRLVNVRYLEGKGLVGDLEYLKSHPMADRVCEAAERMPDMFGLSHNAEGEGDTEDGVFVVHHIVDVRHVDLVPDAATNKSLSESYVMPATTWNKKAFLEAAQKSDKLTDLDKEFVKTTLEMYEEGDDDGMDDHKTHVLKAVETLLNSEDDEAHEKVKALMNVINPKPEEEEEEEEEIEPGPDKTEKPHVPEGLAAENASLKEQIETLKNEKALAKHVRQLCEASNIQVDDTLIDAAVATGDAKKIKSFVESLKKINRPGRLPPPRSQGPATSASNGKRLDRQQLVDTLRRPSAQ
jgi:hypothetical protein